MKLKNPEHLQDEIGKLGLAAVSKISSINYASKLNFPLDGLLATEAVIREIECTLWTIIPLANDDDQELFEAQIKQVEDAVKLFIEAARLMRSVQKGTLA